MSNVVKVNFKKQKLEKFQKKFDSSDLVLVICVLTLLSVGVLTLLH